MNVQILAIVLCLLGSSFLLNAQISKDSTLESILDLSIEELMNTKVKLTTKSGKSNSESPPIITIITEDIIKNSGAQTIEDILQYVPGFEFSKPRTGNYSMGIRKVKDTLTSARFLILKDGVPYNGIMHGTTLSVSQQFDINTIKQIEIIRDSGSALYDKNAFIGVINIITKSPTSKKNIHSSVENYNSYWIWHNI